MIVIRPDEYTKYNKAMPLTRELLDQYIAQNGPWAYHNTANLANVDGIEKEGLVYSEDRLDSGDAGSREGHHYLYVGAPRNFAQFKIDLRKLDPEHFMLDTDAATLMEDWNEEWEMGEGAVYVVKEYFQDHPHWDSPENVFKGLVEHHTFAYKEDIPPTAISRNELFWSQENNVERYERAVNGRIAEQEKWDKIEREYNELKDRVRNAPENCRHGNFVWLEDGEVWRLYEGGGILRADGSEIPEEVREAMRQEGYLTKDEYEMRMFMLENAEKVSPEHRQLMYDPAKDKYGMIFLQHKARMEGVSLEDEMNLDGPDNLEIS